MDRHHLISALFAFTLIAVAIVALFYLGRVRRSQRRSGDPSGTRATRDAVNHPTGGDRAGEDRARSPRS
jgi:uncharacterized membrane protein